MGFRGTNCRGLCRTISCYMFFYSVLLCVGDHIQRCYCSDSLLYVIYQSCEGNERKIMCFQSDFARNKDSACSVHYIRICYV